MHGPPPLPRRPEKKFWPRIVLFLIAYFISFTPHSIAAQLDSVTLQLKWFHQFQFAGYYAALEKGFYEDEGLDVTILERDLNFNPVHQVLEGKADFGVSNSAILLHYLRGDNVVLLASVFQHSPLVFISKTRPLIHTPQDFAGRKILMSTASQDIELLAMLNKEGIDLGKLNLIDRFATPEDYFNSEIDVAAAYITNEPYYLDSKDIPYSVIFPATYGIDFYGDTLFTSRSQVAHHPERVRKFLRASLKGWEYALNNTDELIEIIVNKFGSIKTREHLKFEAEAIKKLIQPELVRIGHTNPNRWETIGNIFRKLDAEIKPSGLDEFFYDPSADRFVVRKETVIYITALFSIVILILFFTIYVARKLTAEIQNRKLFEQQLRDSEKYYRGLFENTGTATVILKDDFTIARCNNNFVELGGYERTEVENKKKWTEFVAEEDIPRMRGYSLSRGKKDVSSPTSYDFKFIRKNGETRNIHVFVEIIEGSRDRIASLIDMTEKIKTQELLIQMEKMLSVGGLAAGMAHEINNPLAGILQGTQNIKRRISPEAKRNDELATKFGCSSVQIHKYLDERGIIKILDGIQDSGERAAAIVRNMLDFTRKNETGRTACDINRLIEGVIDIISCDYDLRKKYDFRHTTIIKEFQEKMSPVKCYRVEIEQVLLNLIKNAAYAMYETSESRPPCLTLRTWQDPDYTTVEVEDNGPGINGEVKRRIFEPFFTTKSPGFGTGLGLSVSFFIITRNHNGIFEVESDVGMGTKFIFKLPTN
ncbi:ABC transporter substrate-binding protein [Maridesulfovibrio sp.]|uniref:ABC transporter substrate-binding protein n=1 Tax=Maridesulfovibrio sp. TaxID=2795000 RepID=UPI002A1881FB|nr:ABC transporter substrate-binding protein [Maridesulfovibrio sp.]